ncbi:EAL and HDOD domain-containing protein [Alishewanella jeotgali]|uniref:EAL domain-containing protein n=1 Tax=Alishewanella jeotgali KCTC 22429 TaxID=1129374 RepID=H3ZDY5_9ALTE|nr:EAL domain-containing protein [Alishewanella jeotgali]EHR41162.1 EAL domain-containing protein [Alishewanella jeotgali KCTC 22429]
MYGYIARQPIFNKAKETIGYELLFRDGEANAFPKIDADEATSKLIMQHHLLMGVEKVTSNKLAFINFSEETLLHHFPTSIKPESMVIEVLETVPPTPELLATLKYLKELGYQLALDDHDFDPKWDPFLPFISYLKVDVQQFNLLQISRHLRRVADYPFTLLAERVETAEQFEKLKLMGFQLFQGYFFARPEMLKHKQLSSNKANLLALMAEASACTLDFERLADICQRDLGLSYKLLRFINHSGQNQAITSVKHAMVYMGEAELKKFIALLALANLQDGSPDELLRQSLVRARFCDALANHVKLTKNPPSSFLTGLFSNVHLIVEQPQDELLAQLPLLPEVKLALLKREGQFGHFLKLTEALEQADWPLTDDLLQSLPEGAELAPMYLEAVAWAESILRQV